METVQEHVRVIVYDDKRRVLLLRRSAANKRAVGLWELPGGKTDGEGSKDAAIREFQEETGILAGNLELLGDITEHIEKDLIFHTIVYGLEPKRYTAKLSAEHDKWEWVALEKIHHFSLAKNSRKIVQEIVLPNLTD